MMAIGQLLELVPITSYVLNGLTFNTKDVKNSKLTVVEILNQIPIQSF